MSDENPTHPTRITRKPVSPEEQRARKQARLLKAYRECGNVKASCKAAGIHRSTFYDWRANDEAFAATLAEAEKDACDTLEMAAYERAVKGVESIVVSMGRVVYEEIPLLDDEGKPKLDKRGEPMYQHGKAIKERKYSDTLLITLLKARLPEKYRERQHIDLTAHITQLAEQAKDELLNDLAAALADEDAEQP